MATAEELTDVFLAYRQAKNSVFLEGRGIGLRRFATFESSLHSNLVEVADTLGDVDRWFDNVRLGRIHVVPKAIDPVPELRTDTTFIGQRNTAERYDVRVRLQLAGTVPFYIAEMKFLWEFGDALDALIPKESVGYRLNRKAFRSGRAKTQRHLFEYWPTAYQEFRRQPIERARELLREHLTDPGRGCFLASLDLSSFYDSIDPTFLLRDDFVSRLSLYARTRGSFDEGRYRAGCESLLRFYTRYRVAAAGITGVEMDTGIPIGAITSRVVANVALESLDRHILRQADVRCYRRYVDDILIVADVGVDATKSDLVSKWIPMVPSQKGLRLDAAALARDGSNFHLQRSKLQKHFLSGAEGLDFLDGVQLDLQRISSERRAFFDEHAIRAKNIASLVRASDPERSPLRVLREADRTRLASRELSTALIFLTRAVTLLGRREARLTSQKSLSPAAQVLTSFADWADGREFVPRILRIAITADDWVTAKYILDRTEQMWGTLAALESRVRKIRFGNKRLSNKRVVARLRKYLLELRHEAVCAALPVDRDASVPRALKLTTARNVVGLPELIATAKLFAAADLRFLDREDEAIRFSPRPVDAHGELYDELIQGELQERLALIQAFSQRCQSVGDRTWGISPISLFLATRPPTYFDIARRVLLPTADRSDGQDPFQQLREITNAIRGTAYYYALGRVVDDETIDIREDASPNATPVCRLILGNVVMDDAWFTGASQRVGGSPFGQPVLTASRLIGLGHVLTRADFAARSCPDPRNALLVLPELSVPRAWLRSVARYAVNIAGFGIVMGLEYYHHATRPIVFNQVIGVFPAPYRGAVVAVWTKGNPADVERRELKKVGVGLAPSPRASGIAPRVMMARTRFGDLSTLICSELIEADLIGRLVGRAEVVLAPSWNQDTDSYDHLIQAVGLQTSSIVAVCNNGHYSDCRAWAPKQTRWQRDLCRLIHRDVDEIIWVDLPIASLRAFRKANEDPPPAGEPASKDRWRPLPPNWPHRK